MKNKEKKYKSVCLEFVDFDCWSPHIATNYKRELKECELIDEQKNKALKRTANILISDTENGESESVTIHTLDPRSISR